MRLMVWRGLLLRAVLRSRSRAGLMRLWRGRFEESRSEDGRADRGGGALGGFIAARQGA